MVDPAQQPPNPETITRWIELAKDNPFAFVGMMVALLTTTSALTISLINSDQRIYALVVLAVVFLLFGLIAVWFHRSSNSNHVSEALAKEIAWKVHESLEGYALNESREQQIETWASVIASVARNTGIETDHVSRLRIVFANSIFERLGLDIREEVREIVKEALGGPALLDFDQ